MLKKSLGSSWLKHANQLRAVEMSPCLQILGTFHFSSIGYLFTRLLGKAEEISTGFQVLSGQTTSGCSFGH